MWEEIPYLFCFVFTPFFLFTLENPINQKVTPTKLILGIKIGKFTLQPFLNHDKVLRRILIFWKFDIKLPSEGEPKTSKHIEKPDSCHSSVRTE